MAKIDMTMPQMGESIAEGTILKWLKKVGDKIERDETILEISTDKVDSEIPSPTAGVITKILVEEGKTVNVGTVIAHIDTDASAAQAVSGNGKETAAPAPAPKPAPAETAGSAAQPAMRAPEPAQTAAAPAAAAEISARDGNRFYSPLVRSIAKEENVSPKTT
jgi:2-oxoglutarate dehydrogenase E2 component (dihydrolipoamide succinyltransferase)